MRLTFSGIAALSVTFLLAVKRKVTKRKLPAAPASIIVGAFTLANASRARRCRFWQLKPGQCSFFKNNIACKKEAVS